MASIVSPGSVSRSDEAGSKPTGWRRRLHAWWEGYELPPETPAPLPPEAPQPAPTAPEGYDDKWSGSRIKVAELVWGDGFSYPGSAEHAVTMAKPLSLNKKKSLLYVGCGLGGAPRAIAKSTGAWTIGLEASRSQARQGMEYSEKAGMGKRAPIEYFDPAKVELKADKYDAIYSRNVFVGVPNKLRLLTEMGKGLRLFGHLLVYDFVLSSPDAASAELHAWSCEEDAPPHPSTLEELTQMVASLKLDIRIAEDVTAEFRAQVAEGWSNLTGLMDGKSLAPDEKLCLVREIKLWQHRLAALQSGALRVVRLHAIKPLPT